MIVPESARPYIRRQTGKSFNDASEKSEQYEDRLQEQFDLIKPFLPATVARILDIGCGMAGIDVLLKAHYPTAELWLLDGDGDDPRTGWNSSLGAFNSRLVADEFLGANGVKADRWINIDTKEHLQADLVISLASWGYHYPIKMYSVSGYCIADLRKPHEPVRGRIIQTYPKRNLCAWTQ